MQNGNGKIVFDIDNTICFTEGMKYEKAIPNFKIINKINTYYDLGYKIILNTARGYESNINWRKVTENQLNNWGVKYHELIFNKPSADLYIDDKACNINDWEPEIEYEIKINKPWGREFLLTLNKNYAMKRLEIDAGKKLSLQYHKNKQETMHIINGKGKAKIENEEIEIFTGKTLNILPNTIHQIEAITNLIIIECSTTELNDIVRLNEEENKCLLPK